MKSKNYSTEFLKQITEMGMLGYDVDKIINVLDIPDIKQFRIDFITIGSEIRQAYKQGQDKLDYEIDMKLLSLAKEGDIKALEKFERRRNPVATLTERQVKHVMTTVDNEQAVIKVPDDIKKTQPSATIKKRNPPATTKATKHGDSKTTVDRKRTTTKKVDS